MSARGWHETLPSDHHKTPAERREEAQTRQDVAQWRAECGHSHTTNGLARCRSARSAS